MNSGRMGVRGVIMAGGRSERMRASNGDAHKALVTVAGRPLLEHNLELLLSNGIDDIAVVSSANEPAIAAWVSAYSAGRTPHATARIASVLERVPLGNIGIIGELAAPDLDLAIVYVDNLCSLDLRAMLARHRSSGAALTIATHTYALRNAFGELDIENDRIVAYREKPIREVAISSGTCIASPAAAALVPRDRATGAADLFAELARRGMPVGAFHHETPWIDVNDRAALVDARAFAETKEGPSA